jgi:demethylmenaquinone methyltransferase / 2-methoxy-6-polyprenyl-1,4-benzoquinol methylase
MPNFRLILILLPILVGIGVVQYTNYYYQREGPPPIDYGNGNMFNQIAARYDTINRILAMGMDISWRQRMVQIVVDRVLSQQQDGQNRSMNDDTATTTTKYIVDFATGTADVAILLAKEIQNRITEKQSGNDASETKVHIIGIDPSEQMISIGRQKVLQQAFTVPKIDLHISDVQNLTEFKMKSAILYDAATMAFGIRNVPDRRKAFCEIHTTLKTNATLCILEFSEPTYANDGFIGGILAKNFIKYIIPFLGGILSGYPKEYWHLQNSIKDFPTPTEFSRMITSSQLECNNYYSDDDTTNESTISNNVYGPLYALDDIISMNFGSVQLYVFRTLPISTIPSSATGTST